MNSAAIIASFLALAPSGDMPILKAFRDRFNAPPNMEALLFIIAGVLALGTIVLMIARFLDRDRRRSHPVPPDPFTEIFAMLHLQPEDRRLLRNIAEEAGLAEPASMLLSPMNLSLAAAPLLNDDRNGSLRSRLDRLCRELFEVPLPVLSNMRTARHARSRDTHPHF